MTIPLPEIIIRADTHYQGEGLADSVRAYGAACAHKAIEEHKFTHAECCKVLARIASAARSMISDGTLAAYVRSEIMTNRLKGVKDES